jgi:hypothetical protein
MYKKLQGSSSSAAAMDLNKKNHTKGLRQKDSLKSFSLLRPRSTPCLTTMPDPEVGLGEFEPTETEEYTETENYDESQHAIVATQVEEENSIKEQKQHRQQQQREQQQLPIIPSFSGKKEEKRTTTITKATTKANANTARSASPVAVGIVDSKNPSSTPLLSVQELIDRLHEVNQDATVYRNKRRNRRVPRVPALVDIDADENVHDNKKTPSSGPPRPHLLNLDDLTSVLKHINMAEEAKRPIRWDLVGEMTAVLYGARPQSKDASYDTESADGDATTSVESTSREIISMMLDLDETVSSDCETTEGADGYALNPSAYTCASSVTWWEGSMYEEIEVSDDECDFYEEDIVDDENEHSCVSLEFEGECASFIGGS